MFLKNMHAKGRTRLCITWHWEAARAPQHTHTCTHTHTHTHLVKRNTHFSTTHTHLSNELRSTYTHTAQKEGCVCVDRGAHIYHRQTHTAPTNTHCSKTNTHFSKTNTSQSNCHIFWEHFSHFSQSCAEPRSKLSGYQEKRPVKETYKRDR